MTPNPQNIGAAPEEYPIRALVKANNDIGLPKDMEGRVSNWRRSGWDMYDSENKGYLALDEHLIIDPTPEQIAEERAKAGLPPQEGEALPEPQAKGPSLPEVPQPGEGVDATEWEAFRNWRNNAPYEASPSLAAWKAWQARATLGKAGA